MHVIHRNFAADPHTSAAHPLPAAGGSRAAHDAPRAVDGAVERFLGEFVVFAANDDGNIPHAAADEADLSRMRRRCAFADNDQFLTAVLFLPGEIVVVVHFERRLYTENAQHFIDDYVSARIGVRPGQLHRLVVGTTYFAV